MLEPVFKKTAAILENAESYIEHEFKSDVKSKTNFKNLVKIYKSTNSMRLNNQDEAFLRQKSENI